MGDCRQAQIQNGSASQSSSSPGFRLIEHQLDLLQVELKVMELLGGAEALPEDILRILKSVKLGHH